MKAVETFEEALTDAERRTLGQLTTPVAISSFLDGLTYSPDPFYRCPLRVLRDGKAHCYDGALFAAMALERLGYPPLILDMLPSSRDDDHVLAVFKQHGHWGAVAKSNFVGLRFRDPVYRSLRELVMSYFEDFFNVEGEKTLRGYTIPLNLKTFHRLPWMTEDGPMDAIAQRLDEVRRFSILSDEMIENLSLVDQRSLTAGSLGANEAGLWRP